MRGREIKEHSLSVLYRHIRHLHIAALGRLLPPSAAEKKARLDFLDSACITSRYSPTFQPGTAHVTHLMKWVLDLLDACHEAARFLFEADI